jgi:SAM-dependent methyltransferase
VRAPGEGETGERPAGEEALSSRALEDVLAEQQRYYRERTPEYDDWWFRRGRYDHGRDINASWFAEVAELERFLDRLGPLGEVLELACGTGLWTGRLLRGAGHVTALDASQEALALARGRNPDPRITFLAADVFAWEPQERYDVCFFSFWLSHVPEERFAAFWEKVARALLPGGRAVFLDTLRNARGSARDQPLAEPGAQLTRRQLADGREFRIVKRFHEPRELERRLHALGWEAQAGSTRKFFLFGHARPSDAAPGALP